MDIDHPTWSHVIENQLHIESDLVPVTNTHSLVGKASPLRISFEAKKVDVCKKN